MRCLIVPKLRIVRCHRCRVHRLGYDFGPAPTCVTCAPAVFRRWRERIDRRDLYAMRVIGFASR